MLNLIMLEAMPPNTEANIAPLWGLLSVRKVGNINPMSFVKILWQAIFHEFYKVTAIAGQITTSGVKVNCCKS